VVAAAAAPVATDAAGMPSFLSRSFCMYLISSRATL
jgi:hypothetical protein